MCVLYFLRSPRKPYYYIIVYSVLQVAFCKFTFFLQFRSENLFVLGVGTGNRKDLCLKGAQEWCPRQSTRSYATGWWYHPPCPLQKFRRFPISPAREFLHPPCQIQSRRRTPGVFRRKDWWSPISANLPYCIVSSVDSSLPKRLYAIVCKKRGLLGCPPQKNTQKVRKKVRKRQNRQGKCRKQTPYAKPRHGGNAFEKNG